MLAPLSTAQKQGLAHAARVYNEQLWLEPWGFEYLNGRGLTRETINHFRLGAVMEPVDESHRRFQGMICIPNLSGHRDEHPVNIKFRDLDPEADKKYDGPSGQVLRLFNLRALNSAVDSVCVVEGEFDAMVLAQCGLPAIGVPGAQQFGAKSHGYRARMLDGLEVILLPDNDKAGSDLVRDMSDLRNLTVRTFPAGVKDTTELYLQLLDDNEGDRDMTAIEMQRWVLHGE